MDSTKQRADNISALFEPRSVAIVGASKNPAKHGHRLVANLKSGDPNRIVYPITRSPDPILGYESYAALSELPEAPDLVLVSIPAEGVPAAISEAAAVGARAAIIFACGFAEAGAAGKALQQRVTEAASGSGLRVVGPNCMGVYDVRNRLKATYYTQLPTEPGHVGFISQSGAFAGVAFTELSRSGVGLSRFASIGNMADVSHAELIRYLGSDASTRVIAAFIEWVSDGGDLLDAIGEVSPTKPIVILKGARTRTGQLAAASHTGALAGERRFWDALLREAGALIAEDTEDLFDSAITLVQTAGRSANGRRLGIVTISGGPAVVAADVCERHQLELPNLSDGLRDIRPLVPPFASLENPVDFTSMVDPDNYASVVATVTELEEVQSVLAINVGLDQEEFAEAFVRVWNTTEKPVVGYLVGETIERIFTTAGIPNLPTIERAVRAIARVVEHSRISTARAERATSPSYAFRPTDLSARALSEHEAKELLAAHGISVTRESLARSIEAAVSFADGIGYPVVAKVCDATVTHKSDVGGLVLAIQDAHALRIAWRDLTRRFPGKPILVSEYIRSELELIIGGHRDPLFGPIIMLGIGGIYVEVLDDVTFARAPIRPARNREMIDDLRHQILLDGFRGSTPVDRATVAEMLDRVSALLAANPQIAELDLNPVIVSGDRLVVADALVVQTPDANA
jgi:acetyltransferase